jgi:hypothetical protein
VVSVPPAAVPIVSAVRKKKNATLAAVLSFLVCGLGHFYLAEWKRGALWLAAAIALLIALAVVWPQMPRYLAYIVPLLSALDARRIAKAKYS